MSTKTKTKTAALRAAKQTPVPAAPAFSLTVAEAEGTTFVSARIPKRLLASVDCVVRCQESDRTKVLVALLERCIQDGILPKVSIAPDPGQTEMALSDKK